MPTATRFRSHTCGELRAANAGKPVRLCGFVEKADDPGTFMLRDRHGATRVVLGPNAPEDVRERGRKLTQGSVVMIAGDVARRTEADPREPTGEVYIAPRSLEVLSVADPLPPAMANEKAASAADLDTRLSFRSLDLRRPELQRRLALRARVLLDIRSYLATQGFLEVETPLLTKWTPEAAQAFVVAARGGAAFALPQNAQLWKQLLVAGGCDRYFQVARCFRNEEKLSRHRQPEFTVLDLEMAYVDEEDVFPIVDGLMAQVVKSVVGRPITLPIPRITWREAMDRYGTDRPDTRFGLELEDLSVPASRWRVPIFTEALAGKGGGVFGFRVPGARDGLDAATLERFPALVRSEGGRAYVTWMKVASKLMGPVAQHFEGELADDLQRLVKAKPGDMLFFFAAKDAEAARAAAAAGRVVAARALGLGARDRHELVWVTEFPFYAYDPAAMGMAAARHPFTQPRETDLGKIEGDRHAVRTKGYDLVMNGIELGAGSIRNHDLALQHRILKMFEYPQDEVERRWGFLLEAMKWGMPPHGGIALGFDRLLTELLGLDGIDEVMAFPKSTSGRDPLTGAPVPIDKGFARALLGA